MLKGYRLMVNREGCFNRKWLNLQMQNTWVAEHMPIAMP